MTDIEQQHDDDAAGGEVGRAVAAILAARPTFRVGDRVRIRVDHECTYCVDPQYAQCYADALTNDGRTAVVVIVDPDTPHDPTGCFCNSFQPDADGEESTAARHAHRWWVMYDERMPHDEPRYEGVDFDQHFAATELELISPAGGAS